MGTSSHNDDDKTIEYSLKDVSRHCSVETCWIVYNDSVYDATPFLHEHPGGMEILLENAGHDVTGVFQDVGHSKEASEIMASYYIGELIENERICRRKVNTRTQDLKEEKAKKG